MSTYTDRIPYKRLKNVKIMLIIGRCKGSLSDSTQISHEKNVSEFGLYGRLLLAVYTNNRLNLSISVLQNEELLVTEGQLFGKHSGGCIKVINNDRSMKKSIGPKYGHNLSFVNPSGVCVDGNGNFFIADKCNNNVTMFNPNSSLIATVVTHDLEGPCGITIANHDLLVVTDCYHHTVKLYKYKQGILL